MDGDKTSSNWVLVSKIDCAEDALTLNAPIVILTDSDQESDGSISIISDHPTDSYSEEEYEPAKVDHTNNSESVLTLTTEASQPFMRETTEDVRVAVPNSTTILEGAHATAISEGVSLEASISCPFNDCDVSSTCESLLSKQLAHIDNNAKEDLKTPESPFYLDCSQEPILEISSADTEYDTESTISNQECQTGVRSQDVLISNGEARTDGSVNMFGIGFLFSMAILILSHFVLQYSEYQDIRIQSQNTRKHFLEGILDSKEAGAAMDFCIEKQKSKGDYSEYALEKCVIKRLRKKNKEETIKNTEIYLQIKERMLEIKEHELAEKEQEILHKWQRKDLSSESLDTGKYEEIVYSEPRERSEEIIRLPKYCDDRFHRQSDYKGRKKHAYQKNINFHKKEKKFGYNENSPNSFQKKRFWVVNENKEGMDRELKKHSEEYIYANRKKVKLSGKDMKGGLKHIKENIKNVVSKLKLKDIERGQNNDANEEWYIKYNPVKNVIELVDITTLPDQDSLLIREGNKTINGQWYFSLYGASRNIIRDKESVAEWYFKRGNLRENKRNKAKWYFDYMSARDDTRYFNN